MDVEDDDELAGVAAYRVFYRAVCTLLVHNVGPPVLSTGSLSEPLSVGSISAMLFGKPPASCTLCERGPSGMPRRTTRHDTRRLAHVDGALVGEDPRQSLTQQGPINARQAAT